MISRTRGSVHLRLALRHHYSQSVSGIGRGSVVYAPAGLIVASMLWVVGLAALVVIFSKQSGPHYRHELGRR